MTDQDAAKILKQNRIVFDPNMKATQFSGAAPFLAFLKKGKIRSRLEKEFGAYRARSIMQILVGIIKFCQVRFPTGPENFPTYNTTW